MLHCLALAVTKRPIYDLFMYSCIVRGSMLKIFCCCLSTTATERRRRWSARDLSATKSWRTPQSGLSRIESRCSQAYSTRVRTSSSQILVMLPRTMGLRAPKQNHRNMWGPQWRQAPHNRCDNVAVEKRNCSERFWSQLWPAAESCYLSFKISIRQSVSDAPTDTSSSKMLL